MSLKLTYKIFLIIKFMIWACFIVFAVYNIDAITKRSTVLYEMIIAAFLIQLTLIQFLNSWYRKGVPLILDWFRLTIFNSLVFNYFKYADKIDQKITWLFGGITLDQNKVLITLFVIFVGLLALKISDILFLIIKSKRKIDNDIDKESFYFIKRKFLFYLLGGIVFFGQLTLVSSGVTGYGNESGAKVSDYSFLLIVFDQLAIFYLIVLGFMKFKYNKNSSFITFFYYLFLAVSIITGLLSGMKETTIIPLICFLIAYLFNHAQLPLRNTLIAMFLLIFLYPLNDNYRNILNNFPSLDKKEAMLIAVADTFNDDLSSIFNEGKEKFSDRLSLYPVLQYSVEHENEWTYYRNMDRYFYLPISFLPRGILKDKPKSDTGMLYSKLISGDDKNSQTATTFGWAYMEGGIIYVFFTFMLLGIFVNIIQFYFNKNNLLSIFLYSSLLISFLKVEADSYFLISGFIQTIIIFVFSYNFFIKKKISKN